MLVAFIKLYKQNPLDIFVFTIYTKTIHWLVSCEESTSLVSYSATAFSDDGSKPLCSHVCISFNDSPHHLSICHLATLVSTSQSHMQDIMLVINIMNIKLVMCLVSRDVTFTLPSRHALTNCKKKRSL